MKNHFAKILLFFCQQNADIIKLALVLNLLYLFISGSGNFSDVYKGMLNENKKVAIKVLKDETNYKEFFKEAFAASELNHENIIDFLGICIEPTNMIIFEFMEGGELLTYLRYNEEKGLTGADLMEMISDICKGCNYMELMKFVHRDLASRNCLLTSTDPLIRKVKYKYIKMFSSYLNLAIDTSI